MSKTIDTAAARELKIFVYNSNDLYRSQTICILKNLATKKARGIYDFAKAVKLWGYLVESGAKKYAQEFGGTWHVMFDVATRKACAEAFAAEFETEWLDGEHRDLLPKKYQTKA